MIPLFSSAIANDGMDLSGAVQRVVASSWFVLGQEVAGFEQEFAQYCGVEHCISVANGTDALELALRGLGIGPGDRVVAVANAGFYGSTAIHLVGATPVYVDIDLATMTMSPEALQQAIAQAPAAIIVTHLYGQLADMPAIMAMADAAGIPVVEDCAQSHGARHDGKVAGSWGTVGCFSFYPTKNLGALGDGGAITTNDAELAARIKQLRQYGWSTKYVVSEKGGRNSRLDEMQAAVLREKLRHLDYCNAQRRAIAARYNTGLAATSLTLPPSTSDDYVAHLYVVRSEKRDVLASALRESGVGCDIHYPIPDHQQPAHPLDDITLPHTEAACQQVLSLPCFPGLTEQQVDDVIGAVKRCLAA